MLIRIVKMTFEPNEIQNFQDLFKRNQFRIRHFEGCLRLELYQDQNNPSIFFTYSYWESQKHLNTYRHSDLFARVWQQTKAKFSQKPQAWSLTIRFA